MERSLCILLFFCSFSVFSNTILYSYDSLGRVEYAQKENSSDKHYLLYDNAGNRVSSQNSPATPPSNSISIILLSPENLSSFDYPTINFSWQLIGDDTDIVNYEFFLSSDIEPKSYISGLTKTQISTEGIIPEFDLYWKVHAIDKYGRIYSSEIQLIKPLDTDSDGLSDYIESNRMCTDPNNVDSDNDGLSDNEEHYNLGTNPCNNDTDNDGMTDAWELLNTLDPLVNDADIDSDGDGISNVEEYITGSDPQDATSVPFKRALIDFEDQTFGEYYWHADGHAFWLVDSHSNTGNFGVGSGLIERNQYSVMETTINAVNGMVRFDAGIFGTYSKLRFYIDGVEQLNITGEQAYATYTYPVSAGQKTLRWEYYRSNSTDTRQVRAWLDNILLPGLADSDGDGIADGWEYRYFNQLDHVMTGDADNDGLTDAQEEKSGTFPNNSDSDSDGMLDGWEVLNNLDPLVNNADLDSDGDGISNVEEFYSGSDPQDNTSVPAIGTKIDFEDQTFGEFYWHSDGHTLWLVDSHANTGSFGARSGIITHSQYSVIETTINAVGGMVRFDAGVSSESSDKFRFYIDGIEQLSLNGEQTYATYAYPIYAGPVTLRWEYYKDFSVDTGQDRAWLDNIILPGVADSDSDGIADGWEYNYFGRLDHVLEGDSDNDGLTDVQESLLHTNPNSSDSDNDGMPDLWEHLHLLEFNVDDSAEDNDHDGYSNIQEYLGGTDPNDNTSVPDFTDSDGDGLIDTYEQTIGTDPTNVDSDFDGMSDGWEVNNQLNPLVNDAALDTDLDGYSNLVEYEGSSDPQDILSIPGVDSDGDGLSDAQEVILGTNPNLADSDFDSIPDGWEVDNNLNPLLYDSYLDADNDGVSNMFEYMFNTDPNDPLSFPLDSDNDGLFDAWEEGLGTDINNPDSDSDTMPDGWEVFNNLNPLIDDSQQDSDGDGFTNIEEYQADTDPQDEYSLPEGEPSTGGGTNNDDTDGDGMPDSWEQENGLDSSTNDAELDKDNDGFNNLEEYLANSDCQDPLSVPFGTVVSVGNTSLTPFYWFNEGDALWQTDNVESSSGYQMLRSGVILDNQSTTMRTIVNSQGGLLRFNLSIDSEECYDFLTLLINGQEYGQWCGYGDHNIRIQLPLGKQELKWIYSKDGSYAESEDASWINNLFIPALPDSDNDGIEDALEYEEFGHLNGN